MDLFDRADPPDPNPERRAGPRAPLAERMRPKSLDEVLGQDAILGPDGALRLAIEQDSEAAAIMRDAQDEEFKHFSMDLEYLLRRALLWRAVA